MKKRHYFLIVLVIAISALLGGYKLVFDIPQNPQLLTVGENNSNGQPLVCYENPNANSLDDDGEINLLVWNIYKQNRANWSDALTSLSDGKQLILMQEASLTDDLKSWIASNGWGGNQVSAFQVMGESAGVINLAKTMPSLACGYTELEPWLRLPKSGIYAQYPLSNGTFLAVVNIHAVNFTYGVQEYEKQLDALAKELIKHDGPIIVAGDFNSWSEERVGVIKEVLFSLGLNEAEFSPDHRVRFMTGLPLDHVFYKGLVVKNAKAPESDASDHNPLQLSFSLSQY